MAKIFMVMEDEESIMSGTPKDISTYDHGNALINRACLTTN
jgi:hypothetical protein